MFRHILCSVRNIENSIHFFATDGIGLKVVFQNEHFVEMASNVGEGSESNKTPPMVSSQYQTNLIFRKSNVESELLKGYSPLLSFDVKNLDELLPKLIMKGAILDGCVKHEPHGKFVSLKTPDDIFVTLREPSSY